MRILNNDETKLCTDKFLKTISKEIKISEFIEGLDSVLYEYADFVIGDGNSCPTKAQAENLFCLKKLRDIFIETKDENKR